MRVEGHAVNDESFRLWGENWALEVTAPLPGVLRVRHAPNNRFASPLHPQLPEKHSWAVVAGERRPLRVSRSGEGWLVEADGAALAVDAAANWTFSAGDGRELARSRGFGGSFTAGQPGSPYASHLELAAPVGEAYLGFGEKVGPLDKRGMSLTFWNTDVIPHHPQDVVVGGVTPA